MGKFKLIMANIRSVWMDLRERRNEEGLTLIELMVVVVILGIIAAIAIPSISGAMTSAKVNSTISDLSTIQEAIQRYYVDNNGYPASISTSSSIPDDLAGYLDTTSPLDAWSKPIEYLPQGTSVDGNYPGYIVFSTAGTGNSTTSLASGDYYAAGGTISVSGINPTTPIKD